MSPPEGGPGNHDAVADAPVDNPGPTLLLFQGDKRLTDIEIIEYELRIDGGVPRGVSPKSFTGSARWKFGKHHTTPLASNGNLSLFSTRGLQHEREVKDRTVTPVETDSWTLDSSNPTHRDQLENLVRADLRFAIPSEAYDFRFLTDIRKREPAFVAESGAYAAHLNYSASIEVTGDGVPLLQVEVSHEQRPLDTLNEIYSPGDTVPRKHVQHNPEVYNEKGSGYLTGWSDYHYTDYIEDIGDSIAGFQEEDRKIDSELGAQLQKENPRLLKVKSLGDKWFERRSLSSSLLEDFRPTPHTRPIPPVDELRVVGFTLRLKPQVLSSDLCKLAHFYATAYDAVFLEDLNVASLMQDDGNARNTAEIGWRELITVFEHHGQKNGCHVETVDPNGTTKDCASCGTSIKKPLWVREHSCLTRGFETDRDSNAAANTLKRGLEHRGVVHSEDTTAAETATAVSTDGGDASVRVDASCVRQTASGGLSDTSDNVVETGSAVLNNPPQSGITPSSIILLGGGVILNGTAPAKQPVQQSCSVSHQRMIYHTQYDSSHSCRSMTAEGASRVGRRSPLRKFVEKAPCFSTGMNP